MDARVDDTMASPEQFVARETADLAKLVVGIDDSATEIGDADDSVLIESCLLVFELTLGRRTSMARLPAASMTVSPAGLATIRLGASKSTQTIITMLIPAQTMPCRTPIRRTAVSGRTVSHHEEEIMPYLRCFAHVCFLLGRSIDRNAIKLPHHVHNAYRIWSTRVFRPIRQELNLSLPTNGHYL